MKIHNPYNIIPVLLMYVLFANTFTIGKLVLALASPVFFIGVRMTIAGLILLGYTALVQKKSLFVHKEQYWLFGLISVLHIYIAYIAEFWALKYVLSYKACLLYNLSPFITALCTYVFYQEILSRKKLLGLLVGFIGFIPILMSSIPEEIAAGHWGFVTLPELMLIISVISSALGWLIFRNLITKHGYSSFVINGYAMLFGGIMALGTSLVWEGAPQIGLTGSGQEMLMFAGYTAYMILIANIIGYNLYGILLRTYSPTLLSFFGFTTPLFAALNGFFFLKEPISMAFVASVLIVSLGLYLFYQEELKEKTL
jgi:drug/metabolite transporter (DMT)-like permease